MLTSEVKKYMDKSVLCWLATANRQNEPNRKIRLKMPGKRIVRSGMTTFESIDGVPANDTPSI